MKARLLDRRASIREDHLGLERSAQQFDAAILAEPRCPGMKTLIMVRNPLEVAHSMKERNGTSYSFGLRLWEIYNRRVIEAANEQDRLVTHYDLFFDDAERELRRIAHFIGVARRGKAANAATLVTRAKTAHSLHVLSDLIDARVAPAK